jgi:hypothetical protein
VTPNGSPDRRGAAGAGRRAWLLRAAVWLGFLGVAIALGPRAVSVLAARLGSGSRHSPQVDLDLVGFAARPDWLDGPLLLAVSRDLQPWLQGRLAILDENGARQLLAGLGTVPWVADAGLERVFPDRFRVRFGLRRPVLAVRDSQGAPLCLCDRQGVVLPWVDGLQVPVTVLRREGGSGTLHGPAGEVAGDDRVPAAAAIAVEWRDEFAPLVPGCPRLLEVDTTNLGGRWALGGEPGSLESSYPEVRVVLQRNDGAPVVFGYDRPVGAVLARVPVADKAALLRAVLAEFPVLQGLVAGYLRRPVRWRSLLQPRQGP